jgi:VNT family MFS transporter (synaptic vesicle glycoprotein 2)
MVIAGLSVFFIWFLDSHTHSVIMSCIFSGVTTIGWNVLDVLSVECFPTVLRSTASGLLQATSRVAAIIGNFDFATLVGAHCAVPMVIVSVLLIGGAMLSCLLPDLRRADIQ